MTTLSQAKLKPHASGNRDRRDAHRRQELKNGVEQNDECSKLSKRSDLNRHERILNEDFCQLQVNPNTSEAFHARVLYDKVDALSLNFNFAEDINVLVAPGIILPFQWKWVYQETMSYLRMPFAAVVWSLGLLYIHNGKPLYVHLYYPQDTPVFLFQSDHWGY